MKRALFLITGLAFSFACEKVIDIPLNEADRRVVVEAKLYDIQYESVVKLSKTGTVYDDTGFEKLSGATVVIYDDMGQTWSFLEDPLEAGTYLDTSFVAQPNRIYYLDIIYGEDNYTSVAETNSTPTLDSLDYQIQTGSFFQEPGDTNYFTFYNFSDIASEKNYYQAIPIKNGDVSDSDYIVDDELFNGNTFRQPFFADSFESKDTLEVFLLSINKGAYVFYTSLSANSDGGGFAPTPANPVSNIEGGAIGYFGAFTSDYMSIIFP